MLKKILTVLALALILPSAIRADDVSNPQNLRFTIPKGKGSGANEADTNRKWSAPSICRVRQSTTCVVCETDGVSGIIVGMHVSSGAVGGYAVAIDTGAIPTLGVDSSASTGAGATLVQQKTCEYTLATVDTNKGACGKWDSQSDGIPFSTGLTICAKTSDTNINLLYRVLRK